MQLYGFDDKNFMARIVRIEQKVWLVLLIVLYNMATLDLEERHLELEGKICSLSATRLEELAEHLKVPSTKYSGKSRLIVARALRRRLLRESRVAKHLRSRKNICLYLKISWQTNNPLWLKLLKSQKVKQRTVECQ